MGEPFFTQTVSGKWQIGWIKMSSRLTLLFCHITAAAGILRHSWGHTDMHAQAQALPHRQHKVGGARLGAAYLLLPWQVSVLLLPLQRDLSQDVSCRISSSSPFCSPSFASSLSLQSLNVLGL